MTGITEARDVSPTEREPARRGCSAGPPRRVVRAEVGSTSTRRFAPSVGTAGAALTILTEVGTDLAACSTEGHFVSWLRRCPHTPVSRGKPLRRRRQSLGANRLAGRLRMPATALPRSKTALGATFRRIARQKGGAVAVFAIARQHARLVYGMLRYGQDYVDVGKRVYRAVPGTTPGRTCSRGQRPRLSIDARGCRRLTRQHR
jgi:hypothetical protein